VVRERFGVFSSNISFLLRGGSVLDAMIAAALDLQLTPAKYSVAWSLRPRTTQ